MIPPFRDPHIDPRRWAPHGDWTPEGHKEAADRMSAFAAGSGSSEHGDWGDNYRIQDTLDHIRSLLNAAS